MWAKGLLLFFCVILYQDDIFAYVEIGFAKQFNELTGLKSGKQACC